MQLNWELVLALLLVDSTLVACRYFRKNVDSSQNFPNYPPQRDESCSDGEDDFRAPDLGSTLSEFNGSAFSEIESVLPEDCGRVPLFDVSGYVAGGYAAKPGQYPSYVRLDVAESLDHYLCGGTLISNRHVLTAAHCLRDAIRTWVYPSIYQNAPEKIRHEGLVTLIKPIKFTQEIQPVCLPRTPVKGPEMSLRAVGLGATEKIIYEGEEIFKEPDVLQVLPVHKVECGKHDRHKSTICFESNNPNYVGDTCVGDSGGPIFGIKNGKMTVYGATSYGSTVCKAGTKGRSVNADIYSLSREIVELFRRCGDVDV